jgi:hypothetical protein
VQDRLAAVDFSFFLPARTARCGMAFHETAFPWN